MTRSDWLYALLWAAPYSAGCWLFGVFDKSDFMYSAGVFAGAVCGLWLGRAERGAS